MTDMTKEKTKRRIKPETKNLKGERIDLSIVIPIYNEKESVEHLYNGLNGTLSKLKIQYEVILVDDGSTDGTYDELKKIHNIKPVKSAKANNVPITIMLKYLALSPNNALAICPPSN